MFAKRVGLHTKRIGVGLFGQTERRHNYFIADQPQSDPKPHTVKLRYSR